MEPIKFGVCGLGRIGTRHAHDFMQKKELYELVAGCDLDAKRAEDFGRENNCAGYSSFAEFLANPELELVIISTRSLDHVPNAAEALAAGKFVLLDKPIAVTHANFIDIQKLDQQYPGKLYFLHNLRFRPAFQTIQKIITSGMIGDVKLVKLRQHHGFARRRDWQTLLECGGGQLSCWGPHLIDQGMQLIQSPIKDVWGRVQLVNALGDADDCVKIMLVGENGVIADIEISYVAAMPDALCTVYGNRGTLICQGERNIQLKYIDPSFQFEDRTVIMGNPNMGLSGYGHDEMIPWIEKTVKAEPEGDMWDIIESELACHLYAAIREGVPFPVRNTDALEVVRITEEVKKQNPQFQWL